MNKLVRKSREDATCIPNIKASKTMLIPILITKDDSGKHEIYFYCNGTFAFRIKMLQMIPVKRNVEDSTGLSQMACSCIGAKIAQVLQMDTASRL